MSLAFHLSNRAASCESRPSRRGLKKWELEAFEAVSRARYLSRAIDSSEISGSSKSSMSEGATSVESGDGVPDESSADLGIECSAASGGCSGVEVRRERSKCMAGSAHDNDFGMFRLMTFEAMM